MKWLLWRYWSVECTEHHQCDARCGFESGQKIPLPPVIGLSLSIGQPSANQKPQCPPKKSGRGAVDGLPHRMLAIDGHPEYIVAEKEQIER